MNRLGSAEMGVSMLLLGALEPGWLGRAKGFGGP